MFFFFQLMFFDFSCYPSPFGVLLLSGGGWRWKIALSPWTPQGAGSTEASSSFCTDVVTTTLGEVLKWSGVLIVFRF